MSTAAWEGRGCPLLHGRGRDVHMRNIRLGHADCLDALHCICGDAHWKYILYYYLTIVLTTSKTPDVDHCMGVCACWLGSQYPIESAMLCTVYASTVPTGGAPQVNAHFYGLPLAVLECPLHCLSCTMPGVSRCVALCGLLLFSQVKGRLQGLDIFHCDVLGGTPCWEVDTGGLR